MCLSSVGRCTNDRSEWDVGRDRYVTQIELPSEVVATAWIGERDRPTSAVTRPVGGSEVTVDVSGVTVALPETAEPGIYAQSSLSAAELSYRRRRGGS